MELQSDFNTFLENIRPTKNQRDELKSGHTTLRERLKGYGSFKGIFVADFIQGSYRRATAVRPRNGKRSDVDIVVVTNLDEAAYTPKRAMGLFIPFLEQYYKGKWLPQGRSFGIEMSHISMDLVITSAPASAAIAKLQSKAVVTTEDLEVAKDYRLNEWWLPPDERLGRLDAKELLEKAKKEAEWKIGPLRIPDREAGVWESTDPIEQILWTRDKNAKTDGYFVNVVKALKWWRIEKHPTPKHPKGFPLERLIGECCPDGIASVAEGITLTLEGIVSKYQFQIFTGGKPSLPDYGVPTHDVFARIEPSDFKIFYEQVVAAATLARQALDSQDSTKSGNLWFELLGSEFPKPPDDGSVKKTGFTSPNNPAVPGSERFA
jgi:hypothetical protein